ncbi:MAG: type II toxin-antitoxin system HicA family toxin [Candidatus Scalindua sp.]|nr:type II toxin-antitoxin system HicA family toxin [Candidatus Scalindua sp.]
MSRLIPVGWKVLDCIFTKAGFSYERQTGSHRSYSKPGISRPLVIPTHNEVQVFIISGLIRTAGIKRADYLGYLKQCK